MESIWHAWRLDTSIECNTSIIGKKCRYNTANSSSEAVSLLAMMTLKLSVLRLQHFIPVVLWHDFVQLTKETYDMNNCCSLQSTTRFQIGLAKATIEEFLHAEFHVLSANHGIVTFLFLCLPCHSNQYLIK